MKESKYGRRGSAVPVHDLRIQQLEAEVERLRVERDELRKDNQHLIGQLRKKGVMLSEDGIHDGG